MTSPSPPGDGLAPNPFPQLGNETTQRSAKERERLGKLRTALGPVAAQNPSLIPGQEKSSRKLQETARW
jgi:hypothetical protein